MYLSLKNIFLCLYYIAITSLEIAFIYLLIIYFKNEKGYKIHKLDIFTLFSTLIIFTSFLIQSYSKNELFLVNLISILTEFSLNIILCSLITVTMSPYFTQYIDLVNFAIILVVIVIIVSIIQIVSTDVTSFIYQRKGRIIKLLIYFIEIVAGFITIISSIISDYSKNVEDNLILIVNEQDIYIRHLCASMIRRVKELNKTYLILITFLLNSILVDLVFIFLYKSEYIFSYVNLKGKNTEFTFDDCFIYSILSFLKDVLPFLLIVITTLVLRWK